MDFIGIWRTAFAAHVLLDRAVDVGNEDGGGVLRVC